MKNTDVEGDFEQIAKDQDHFTTTKTGKNKYHIKAEYGFSDGYFTLFDNQSNYGSTSADVTN